MNGGYDLLQRLLSDRPIAFHPMLARALGGINEALFFQQIAYWSGKGSDPEWIYKTQAELEQETTLTRTQQEKARRNLRARGVLEEDRRGVPAKLYYRVLWPPVFALVELAFKDAENLHPGAGEEQETRNLDRGKPADLIAGNLQSNTESTSKSTQRGNGAQTDVAFFPAAADLDRVVAVVEQVGVELRDDAVPGASARRGREAFAAARMPFDAFLGHVDAARRAALRSGGNGEASRMPAFWRALEARLPK